MTSLRSISSSLRATYMLYLWLAGCSLDTPIVFDQPRQTSTARRCRVRYKMYA